MALAIVIVYLLGLLFTSWYSTRLQQKGSTKGFLFADQKLGPWLCAVTIAGLAVGGSSTVGVAQNAFKAGMSAGWYDTAWAAGALLMAFYFAGKLRNSGLRTINQMWNQCFGSGFQTVSLILQCVVQVTIVSLQMVAGGTILSALIPSISYNLGLILSAGIFLIIAVVGGMWSAALSNIINVVIIYVGLAVGLIASVNHFGGMDAINALLPAGKSGDGSHWYNLFTGMGTAAITGWFLTMLLQASPGAGTIQIAFSARDDKGARNGFILGALMMIPAGFISAMFGIIAAGEFPDLTNSAMAMATVTAQINPLLCGILLAGLWAADVSTATGLLVAVSNMATNDFVVKFVKKDMSDKNQVVTARIMIVVFSFLAYIGATTIKGVLSTLMSVLVLWAPYTVLMFGIFYFPKYLKKSSGWGVLIAGIVTFVLCKFFMPSLAIVGQPIYTTTLVSIAAFLICAVADKRVCFEGSFKYLAADALK